MNVIVWGREASRVLAQEHGFSFALSKTEFFQSADVISLHLRLNDATKACVMEMDLEQMKDGALFVNTRQAELIEKEVLYRVMSVNPNKQAAVDVFETEPANYDNGPLLSLPNVLCTPHSGYVE